MYCDNTSPGKQKYPFRKYLNPLWDLDTLVVGEKSQRYIASSQYKHNGVKKNQSLFEFYVFTNQFFGFTHKIGEK